MKGNHLTCFLKRFTWTHTLHAFVIDMHLYLIVYVCIPLTTTLALHVSLKCGVIHFRLCDRKHPHLHDGVLGLARGSPSENVIGFSFGFTTFGETGVVIGGQNRHLILKASGVILQL